MEEYEQAGQEAFSGLAVVRVDARGFGHVVRKLEPEGKGRYSARVHRAMVDAARQCMEHSGAGIDGAWTQSDEISFLLRTGAAGYGDRPMKICTLLASEASVAASAALGVRTVFDGRMALLPDADRVRGYFEGRAALCRANARSGRLEQVLKAQGIGRKKARGMKAREQEEALARGGVAMEDLEAGERNGTAITWERELRTGRDPRDPEGKEVEVVRRKMVEWSGTAQALGRRMADVASARLEVWRSKAGRARQKAPGAGSNGTAMESAQERAQRLHAACSRWGTATDAEARSAAAMEAAKANASLADPVDGRTLRPTYARAVQAAGAWEVPEDWSRVGVWSDLHLGHRKVIGWSERPYRSVEHMDAALLEAWSEGCRHYDVVICVGDLTMDVSREGYAEIARAMPGRQVLVVGNHDVERSSGKLRVEGFETICGVAWGENGGMQAWLTHVPMREVPEGVVNVHGHTHGRAETQPWHRNVSVERTGYRVASLADVVRHGVDPDALRPEYDFSQGRRNQRHATG